MFTKFNATKLARMYDVSIRYILRLLLWA